MSRGDTTTLAAADFPPEEAVTMYVPGRSATNPPSGHTSAPSPSTDQATPLFAAAPDIFLSAAKCRTSPVFAVADTGETETLFTCFFPTTTVVSADCWSPITRIFALPAFIA